MKKIAWIFIVVGISCLMATTDAVAKTCPKFGYCNIIHSESLDGQCVAYCKSKTGYSGKVGSARNWPINSKKPVKGGVVLLNIGTFGHVAFIDSVNEKKRTFEVSQYNFGKKFKCAECGITDKYKIKTNDKYSFDDRRIIGYWKPK